jgi:hypothetical protein
LLESLLSFELNVEMHHISARVDRVSASRTRLFWNAQG